MRFDLDDSQQAFQHSVADFLNAECPVARALAAHNDPKDDLELWRGLMDLGLGAVMVPEHYGGLGLGLLDLAILAEPIGRHAVPGPFLEHALATLAIVMGGSDAQKARWLPDLATGARRGTIALYERGEDWSPEGWGTITSKSTVTTEKLYVLHPQAADLILVGVDGGRFGIVEGNSSGVTTKSISSTDASKGLAHVGFADAAVELLPEPVGESVFSAGLILLAADSFGGASACTKMAAEYAKNREQFGRAIGSFQALKHQLADMTLLVEPTVGLYWFAAHTFDHDLAAAPAAARLAKSHLTELFPKIARRAIEAHGGIGYTWEFGLHVWLKRALFNQSYLGMPRVHRARFADLANW